MEVHLKHIKKLTDKLAAIKSPLQRKAGGSNMLTKQGHLDPTSKIQVGQRVHQLNKHVQQINQESISWILSLSTAREKTVPTGSQRNTEMVTNQLPPLQPQFTTVALSFPLNSHLQQVAEEFSPARTGTSGARGMQSATWADLSASGETCSTEAACAEALADDQTLQQKDAEIEKLQKRHGKPHNIWSEMN